MSTSNSFIYGINPVFEALKAKKRVFHHLFLQQHQNTEVKKIEKLAKPLQIPLTFLNGKELQKKAPNLNHQGVVLDCSELPKSNLKNWKPLREKEKLKILLCESIFDPHNFGAILRTAKFFHYDAILKLRDKSCPINATVSKTSAGALESSIILEETNLHQSMEHLKKLGFWIYGADMQGDSVYSEKPPLKFALVIGNEAEGLRRLTREICDQILSIPGSENFESLNLSVATGVLMSHLEIKESIN